MKVLACLLSESPEFSSESCDLVLVKFDRDLGTQLRWYAGAYRTVLSLPGNQALSEMRWSCDRPVWTSVATLESFNELTDEQYKLVTSLSWEQPWCVLEASDFLFMKLGTQREPQIDIVELSLQGATNGDYIFKWYGIEKHTDMTLATAELPWSLVEECCPPRTG